MQIAKVVPKVKTSGSGIFDYDIPPEILPQMRVGILVEVPFRGRKIEGIVTDIKRASQFTNLKKIIRIIDPTPVIDDQHLALAKWMADYYLSSLGQTLFENIVPPAIRTIKKQTETMQNNNTFLAPDKKVSSKYFLVQADFSHRLKFYLKAIDKTINRGQSVLILIPDLTLINYFTKNTKNPIILHSRLSKTERWLAWDKIRSGTDKAKQIIIGSQSALFAPVQNLGLIIIDQAEDETYKNDRSPYFSAITTAEKLAKISGSSLILGGLNHNIETFFYAEENKYEILKNKFLKPNISIVDTKSEKNIISATLVDAIEQSIQKKEKIILVLNRKGEGSSLTCVDCGWVQTCEKCGSPLRPENLKVVCHNCEKKYDLKTKCPKCQGFNLKKFGWGTKKLLKIARGLWPKEKIINLEKDGDKLINNFSIAIVTSYALKLPLSKIGLVGIIDSDSYTFLPDFRSAEKDFLNFFKFLKISRNGIIQTKNPEHYFVKALAKLDYMAYYQAELKVRYEGYFPPFSHLINLIYQNESEVICQKEAEKLAGKLRKIKNKDLQILGPAPAYFGKNRNFFRWQIIIKTILPRLRELDELLKKQNDWKIDVDPVDLI